MSDVTTIPDLTQEYVSLYKENADHINKVSADFVNHFREKALIDFTTQGIPSRKNEAYKYTNLETYFKGDYTSVFDPENYRINLRSIFNCDIPELDTHVVLILNGFYYSNNVFEGLPEGVIISGFSDASKKYYDLVNRHYSKYADTKVDSLAALNTMFVQDGVFIYVPKGVKLDKPIQIINIGYSKFNQRINQRNLIVVEDNAEANFVVCDHTLCDQHYLSNSVTELYAGKNAFVDYTKIQNENNGSTQLSNTFINQESGSQVTSNTISLHGGLIRNNVYVKLNGQGCENNTYGLFLCDDHQHIATYTDIVHAQPHCNSNQLFKGILDDDATGAFNGKIYVAKDAQKTLAYQRNNNILLSGQAKMNSKPHLEIYADDVKCSHGATVGQLDNEAMFYLRTRGIDMKEAKHLLMYAFANEIIGKINVVPLKERIIDLVDKRLRRELTRCNNCNIGRD